MASIIKLKRSLTPGSAPSSLVEGEIAVNIEDKKLYVGGKNGGANVQTISGDNYNLTTSGNSSISFVTLTVDNDALSNDAIGFIGTDGVGITRNANNTLTFTLGGNVLKAISTDSGTATTDNGILNIAGGDGISTSASGNTITIDTDIATSSAVGVVRPSANQFTVEADGFMYLTDGQYGAVLTINGTSNEVEVSRSNGTVTVGLPDDVTIGQDLFVTRNVDVSGNLQVDGNLTVSGNVTYISTQTVQADDSMLKLAANNAADTVDVGVYGMYDDGTQKYAGWFRDASDGIFKFYTDLQDEPTTTVDTGGTGYTQGTVEAIIDGGTY